MELVYILSAIILVIVIVLILKKIFKFPNESNLSEENDYLDVRIRKDENDEEKNEE